MSEWQRITLAGAIAGLAVAVAAGPRPVTVYSPNLPVGAKRLHAVHGVGQPEDLEAFDCSDVLEAHGVEVDV